MTAQDAPASAYDMGHAAQAEALATFAVLVDNEPGVLHRVVGLFAARGYNIESLTVAETDRGTHTSRITIVTRGTPQVLAQIEAQLERMVSTRQVRNVTADHFAVGQYVDVTGVTPVGNLPRPGDRHHHLQLHLRAHRRAGQDRQVRGTHAAAGPQGGLADGGAVDRAGDGGGLRALQAAAAAAASLARQRRPPMKRMLAY